MVDCTKCKNLYLKMTDKYSGRSACKLGMLDEDAVVLQMPISCSGFEEKQDGKKYDNGKNRMGLMCENFSRALWEVAKISTFGANKYGDNTWQKLSNPKERYMDALCRHLFQHLQGEKVDDESGLLHLQHMCWNALALLEFELKSEINEKMTRIELGLELGGKNNNAK